MYACMHVALTILAYLLARHLGMIKYRVAQLPLDTFKNQIARTKSTIESKKIDLLN